MFEPGFIKSANALQLSHIASQALRLEKSEHCCTRGRRRAVFCRGRQSLFFSNNMFLSSPDLCVFLENEIQEFPQEMLHGAW